MTSDDQRPRTSSPGQRRNHRVSIPAGPFLFATPSKSQLLAPPLPGTHARRRQRRMLLGVGLLTMAAGAAWWLARSTATESPTAPPAQASPERVSM